MRIIKKKYKIVILGVLLFTVFYIFFKDMEKEKELDMYGSYSICVIDKIEFSGNTHHFEYSYTIDGVKYRARTQVGNRSGRLVEKYFIVRYSKRDPQISEILFSEELTNKDSYHKLISFPN